MKSIFSYVFNIIDDMPSQDGFDLLCLLQHLSNVDICVHFTSDQNRCFLSKALSHSRFVIHESPNRKVLTLLVWHANRNLQISYLLASQTFNLDRLPYCNSRGAIQIHLFIVFQSSELISLTFLTVQAKLKFMYQFIQ